MISSNMHKLKHSFHLDVKRRLLFFALWTAYHKAMLNKEIINQSDAERLAFASRIRQAISSLGRGGKTRIAEKCGVSPQAVTGWEKNGRVDKKNLAVIAESAGYSLTWLITGQGQKNHIDGQPTKPSIESNATYLGGFDLWDENTPLDDDEVALPFFREIELAAGSGRAHQVIKNHGMKLRFAKSTLRKKSVTPEDAYCVTVSGNSMEPVLPDGTTIGIDTGKTTIKNGDIYAIDHAGELRVKRVYRLPGGGLRLTSFNNDEWPDEYYNEQECAEIIILGRMFWSATLW